MIEKKVVVVIVEGPSDESAIGSILKEYFSSEEVQFAVTHGDITSDYKTTVDNVVTKICKLVDAVRGKYGYEWKHFIKIIHIADTDGAFTKGCVQKLEDKPEDGQEDKSKEEKIQYYEDHMETSNVEATEKRNEHKSEIMYKLYSTGKILPDSVTSIGSSAFKGCSGLTSVTIPDSVTSVGSSAFEYCRILSSVIYKNQTYTSKTALTQALKDNNVTFGNNYVFDSTALTD